MISKYIENSLLGLGFVAIITVIFYISFALNPPYEDIFPQPVVTTHVTEKVDVNRTEIFNTIADVNRYPDIFPNNYISVQIINKTNDIIFTNETISYQGITKSLIVKHTIVPNSEHKIEVIEGIAKGTAITLLFTDDGNFTDISVNLDMHIHNLVITPGLSPQNGYDSAITEILDRFVDYTNHELK